MSDETHKQPAGWYYAQGDPPGTQRYWDGGMWRGGAQPVPGGTSWGTKDPGDPVPATPGRRIAARLIDVMVWIGIAMAVGVLIGIGMAFSESDELLQNVGQVLIGVLVVLYEFVMVTAGGGTVGKRLLGLRITAPTGPIDSSIALRRVGLLLAYVLLGSIPLLGLGLLIVLPAAGLIMIFVDSKRQTPWDKLAGTVVSTG